jgi:hypothetical protein
VVTCPRQKAPAAGSLVHDQDPSQLRRHAHQAPAVYSSQPNIVQTRRSTPPRNKSRLSVWPGLMPQRDCETRDDQPSPRFPRCRAEPGLRPSQYRWAAGEVPVQVLFQRPQARTLRAGFPATGFPRTACQKTDTVDVPRNHFRSVGVLLTMPGPIGRHPNGGMERGEGRERPKSTSHVRRGHPRRGHGGGAGEHRVGNRQP